MSANRAGYGFVRIEGMTDSVFLPPPQMAGVMHGDRVALTVERGSDGRYSGDVDRIVERGVSAFLARLVVQGRTTWVEAVDTRLALRGHVPPEAQGGAKDGDWVIARITRYAEEGSGPVQARVLRRLDPSRPLEMATETAIAKYDLASEFPPAVLDEARAYGDRVDPSEAANRIDLRDLPLVTIDGEDAQDFDDAVYAEADADGHRIVVAIADVSHYVRPGTALDSEALARGTSVYFPGRVLPMLPEALSNQLCSLAPKVDRLCFVADMRISRQGKLRAAKFYPAVMRSAARLTYTLANAALIEGRPAARAELGPLVDRLLPLVDAYRALAKARDQRGALDFDSTEPNFAFDAGGVVTAIELRARNDAHRLIEECMILANVAVARELGEQRVGTLYRVHGTPESRKLDQLLATLGALGVAAEIPESVRPRDLQAITRRLGEGATRPFIESLIVRSMPQAIYQPTNIGHFGLALDAYAHFTSPIRRYPDLLVHRTLKARLGIAAPFGVRYEAALLASLGEATTRLEKRSDEADRLVEAWLKCSYLQARIGETFDGLITSVVEFGCFVQLVTVGADGLLHLDALRDDRYVQADGGTAWVGTRSGRRLGLGDTVRVVVTRADPVEGHIDLELAVSG